MKIMNIRKIMTITILLTSMLLAGCAAGQEEVPRPQPEEDSSFTAAETFLEQEPTAAEIGIHLGEIDGTVSKETGDLLLERLLLAQLDQIELVNSKIYEDVYLNALNETMGGVLDPSKIADISDETVRQDFQALSDGLMKVVRYEETPVVEPDWTAITSYGTNFSEEAADMALMQSKLQDRTYFGDPYNFDLLATDVIATEKMIGASHISFVKRQLKSLYKRQVGTLLIGPEGSFLSEYVSGSEEAVARIEGFANLDQDSRLGKLSRKLIDSDTTDMMALSDLIQSDLAFSPDDARTLYQKTIDYNGSSVRLVGVTGISDPAVEEKINQTIKKATEEMVKPDVKEQMTSCYMSFVNDHYLSLGLSNNYADAAGDYAYEEKYLTIDLNSGETISLDDLIKRPFAEYKEELMGSMLGQKAVTELDEPVEYLLSDDGLQLLVLNQRGDGLDYYTVSLNGLRRIMDISTLY